MFLATGTAKVKAWGVNMSELLEEQRGGQHTGEQ